MTLPELSLSTDPVNTLTTDIEGAAVASTGVLTEAMTGPGTSVEVAEPTLVTEPALASAGATK